MGSIPEVNGSNGHNSQTYVNGLNGNGHLENDNEYKVAWDRVHSQPDKLKAICVGAGASGLYLAYRMKKTLTPGSWDLTLYEKNPSIGGTWYENRYPGLACDIPAHVYTYSFRPNPNWSTFYARGPEILQYFRKFAKEESLYEFIEFNTRVQSAVWDEAKGIYHVEVDTPSGLIHDWCHVLVNAGGNLNKWRWPDIKGLHDFKGQLLHSANWPSDGSADLKGKRVAVIGTGSSAIQIVPAIQPEVAHLTTFIRSSTWICPAVGQDVVGGLQGKDTSSSPLDFAQHTFTAAEKQKFSDDPEYYLKFRHRLESSMNGMTQFFIRGSEANNGAKAFMKSVMERRLGEGNEELKKKLIPEWEPGCRRLTPGDGYLEALTKDNVNPVFDEITEIDATGLVTADGTHHPVDVLICATGFDVRFIPSFSLTGRKEATLAKEWAHEPNCYLGISAPKFPNYFIVLGPRSPWGNGPLLSSLETMCDHFVEAMQKMQVERIKSLEVKMCAANAYNQHVSAWHRGHGAPNGWKGSVWTAGCRSWYKRGDTDGEVWLWSGGIPAYLSTIKHPRYEDYNIEYKSSNQFAFLGNGMILAETLGGEVAPHIRNEDTPWVINEHGPVAV